MFCKWGLTCGSAGAGSETMASSKHFLYYILDQLSGLEAVTYRGMMGEYILDGGIYPNITGERSPRISVMTGCW